MTIDRFLHSRYDQFAGRSLIPELPTLLAERFARQRLHDQANVALGRVMAQDRHDA